jgi:hypothetical protein
MIATRGLPGAGYERRARRSLLRAPFKRIAAIGLAIWLVVGTAPVAAVEWVAWEDSRTEMRIIYPADLFPESRLTGEGIVLSGPHATLELSARDDLGISSTTQLRDFLINSEGYSSLTYSPGDRTWMVASGYRDNEIYYEKFFVLRGQIRAFSIQYPNTLRAIYDPVVERLEDTFKPW